MNTSNKPKPIQIRLPPELEDRLRATALTTHKTLNSIVISCLEEALPSTCQKDPLNNIALKGNDQIIQEVQKHFRKYRTLAQHQLDIILKLASTLNDHIGYINEAKDILLNDSELEGCTVERMLQMQLIVQRHHETLKMCFYDTIFEWSEVEPLLQLLKR